MTDYPKMFRKLPLRDNGVVRGMRASPYMIRLEQRGPSRRVYEAWDQLEKHGSENPRKWSPVPLVYMVKGVRVPLPEELRPR